MALELAEEAKQGNEAIQNAIQQLNVINQSVASSSLLANQLNERPKEIASSKLAEDLQEVVHKYKI
ncbi:hypothetical protein [uncultured Brevibacillus sp.]|uniref:hypothetical protein n=1 Tax=uncultured Brevibacillus sp. TaxID=169970 RepID=UPI002599E1DF|nr:hypothetical protein [uncultured Brevibacillus sp.]